MAAPPYSRFFAALVARLMRDAGAPLDSPHLPAFVLATKHAAAFTPPLPAADVAAMAALHEQLLP